MASADACGPGSNTWTYENTDPSPITFSGRNNSTNQTDVDETSSKPKKRTFIISRGDQTISQQPLSEETSDYPKNALSNTNNGDNKSRNDQGNGIYPADENDSEDETGVLEDFDAFIKFMYPEKSKLERPSLVENADLLNLYPDKNTQQTTPAHVHLPQQPTKGQIVCKTRPYVPPKPNLSRSETEGHQELQQPQQQPQQLAPETYTKQQTTLTIQPVQAAPPRPTPIRPKLMHRAFTEGDPKTVPTLDFTQPINPSIPPELQPFQQQRQPPTKMLRSLTQPDFTKKDQFSLGEIFQKREILEDKYAVKMLAALMQVCFLSLNSSDSLGRQRITKTTELSFPLGSHEHATTYRQGARCLFQLSSRRRMPGFEFSV